MNSGNTPYDGRPIAVVPTGFVTEQLNRLAGLERGINNLIGVMIVFGFVGIILQVVLIYLLISFANHPFGL